MRPLNAIFKVLIKGISKCDRHLLPLDIFDPTKVNNILIVSSTAIGDTLLSTPAIRAVRTAYQDARIVLHVRNKHRELFEENSNIDRIIPYYGGYKKFWKTIREFRTENFDLVVILHGNGPQAIPMAYLSGAPFVIRLPVCKEFGYLLSNGEIRGFDYWDHHAIIGRLKIASLVGCTNVSVEMELDIDRNSEEHIDNWINRCGLNKYSPLVGFQVGAGSPFKQWPAERFAELGRRIANAEGKVLILIMGSKKERTICRRVARSIDSDRVVSVAGDFSLKQVAALIKRLNLLVTNDTGTMHIGIAVKTRTISLFCPTNAWGVGPIQDKHLHIAIQKDRPCEECVAQRCNEPFCMERITVDEVFQAFIEAMGL